MIHNKNKKLSRNRKRRIGRKIRMDDIMNILINKIETD